MAKEFLMPTVAFSPIGNGVSFLGLSLVLLNGGFINTYQAGTTTPLATYTTNAGNVANSNPIVLNSDGRAPQEIWLIQGSAYKFVVSDALSNVIATYDNISGIDATLRADLANTSSVALGDALVGVKRVLSGAIATTLHAWIEGISYANIVTDYGADPTGVADSTTAIQAALNASLVILVPPGTYKLTSTLIGRANQIIRGYTPEACQFVRTTVYGDTFQIGAAGAGNGAGALFVSGIWFNHIAIYNNGTTFITGTSVNCTNKDPSAAHIRMNQGQNVRIQDCWFSNLGYGIYMVDSSVVWIERNLFTGLWDTLNANLQEATASVFAGPSASHCVEIWIIKNHFTYVGKSVASNVTTGSVTVSKQLNAGPKYGVLINSCERFSISNNYIGGQSINSIYLNCSAILAHGEIDNNLLDGAAVYSVVIDSISGVTWPNFIDIHDNTGVGYGLDQGFIKLGNNIGTYSGTQIKICDNILQFYLRAPIWIEEAVGVLVTGNIVSGYNSDHSVTSDPLIMAGMYVDASAKYVISDGNTWGGGINDPTATNFCKWGPYFSSAVGCSAANERTYGLGIAGGTLVGVIPQNYPVLSDNTAIAPTYAGTWVNYGAPYLAGGYYLDGFGIVHLQGSIRTGTINTAAFTLPAGYRPTATLTFAVVSNNTIGGVTVDSAGVVTPTFGNNAYVSLDGITFRPN
jgi:hypothetical protein